MENGRNTCYEVGVLRAFLLVLVCKLFWFAFLILHFSMHCDVFMCIPHDLCAGEGKLTCS